MRNFIETVYNKIIEKAAEDEEKVKKKENERISKCYVCKERHSLRCDKFVNQKK